MQNISADFGKGPLLTCWEPCDPEKKSQAGKYCIYMPFYDAWDEEPTQTCLYAKGELKTLSAPRP